MKSKLLLCAGGLLVIAAIFIAASPEKKPDPSEAARLNNLGCAYMNQQLFEKALKYFEDAAAVDPNLSVAKLNQGVALMGLARMDAAKKILDEAAKANPGDPHIWYVLGMLDKNSSDPQSAVEDFKRVIEIDDRDADSWYFQGTVYAQLKQFPPAIDAFEHALKLNPLHASAQFGLSRALQQSGNTSAAREHLARFQYITQNHLGAAMSLAYGDQGKYSLAEDSPASALKAPPPIAVKFVDVTKPAGIISVPETPREAKHGFWPGSGACFFDYDNDGRIDLFLANNGAKSGVSLYRNLGDGKFEEVTKQAGLDPTVHGVSCTAGDYDNDGFTDLAVSYQTRTLLLHNEKNGSFKDVTSAAGINQLGLGGLTFIDYDHDGDLDLYGASGIVMTEKLGVAGSANATRGGGMWRNNANGTFTNVDIGTSIATSTENAIGTDYNNDRAVDIVVADWSGGSLFQNPREGKFSVLHPFSPESVSRDTPTVAVTALDYDHDGWMDIALTRLQEPALTLWHNNRGKFEPVPLPETGWAKSFGVAAFDYDNDGWVDLVAVGETREGKGEIKLFRNLGPDGWEDVTAGVGLDKIQLQEPRAIITGDYDNDGTTDLLITQTQGPAVLLKNEGGNKNNWLRLALKGLNDNKSAIGTKVEIFSDGIRQKYEIYGSNGYLGQNSPYPTVGLGQAKQADVVRMLWPTGVLQDEVEIPANQQKNILEIDRRGSSCPTLFVWDGTHYQLVSDMLGAGVVGHWVGPSERNIPRPVEWVKVDRKAIREKLDSHFSQNRGEAGHTGKFSFFLMEPMEEVVYIDAVKIVAVEHPADEDVYPNEYFASNPPYPEFKVVTSRHARPPVGAWDDQGHNLLPDLLAHKYLDNLDVLPFKGFTKRHRLTLDLGEPYRGGPLRLLLHGEIEYFMANSMYAAWQAGINPIAPYLEAEIPKNAGPTRPHVLPGGNARLSAPSNWVRVSDDMGFPAGLPKTITVDLSGKLPLGSRRIRITTNLQIYWDSILIDRSEQKQNYKLRSIPLTKATLENYGYPFQIEDQPPGNVTYIFDKVSRTGPYARQAGEYTRYGDVMPLLTSFDDKLVVFGSGEGIALEFDSAKLPPVPKGWVRDYFFMANGYEKDMDFYAATGNTVEPLPFRHMGTYPYEGKSFPMDDEHLNYMLEYNTRFVSGNEPQGYSYKYDRGR
jgi:tetratricopeptide (TPR) repeat protein